mgnify:CR=1 FL=1
MSRQLIDKIVCDTISCILGETDEETIINLENGKPKTAIILLGKNFTKKEADLFILNMNFALQKLVDQVSNINQNEFESALMNISKEFSQQEVVSSHIISRSRWNEMN